MIEVSSVKKKYGFLCAVCCAVLLVVCVCLTGQYRLRNRELNSDGEETQSQEAVPSGGSRTDSADSAVRRLTLNTQTVDVLERDRQVDGIRQTVRTYLFSGGDRVRMGRTRLHGGDMVVETVTLPGNPGVVRYIDPESGQWTELPLAEGCYQVSTVEIVQETGSCCFLYLPKTYREVGRRTLEYDPEFDGMLQIRSERGAWRLDLVGQAPEEGNYVCDYTWTLSSTPLLDWFYETDSENWFNYTQDGAGKWCFDGYYRTTPSTYHPTGENFIYRCTASYIVQSMADAMTERESAASMTVAMLDTVLMQQNSYGFWETGPESEWLSGDYGIGAGFYDTRFNTDLAALCMDCYEQAGGDFIRTSMERYMRFYTQFASGNHTETKDGGWLVEDYWGPEKTAAVHTSLNHQLAECLTLYRLSDALERDDLAKLADRLLQAVEDTAEAWVNDEGNLHYQRNPDGTYGGTDYPYLTYNDLLALNTYLRTRTGEDNPVLCSLMDVKRAWMDSHGVTEYDRE